MKPFTLSRIPVTYFGAGSLSQLNIVLSFLGSQNILLVTGQTSFVQTEYYKGLLDQFRVKGLHYTEIRVKNEPTPQLIDDFSKHARKQGVQLVLAIGGGSVIDTGKAISAMIPIQGSVLDYLEGVGTKSHSGEKVKMIAVPTTAGTGSEATKNAVISEIGVNGYKKSLRHENFVPDYALIDPTLTLSSSDHITASCGMDALNQLLEAFLSIKSNTFIEALALLGIEHIFNSLERLCLGESQNIELRSKMSYASYLSGIALANAGLGVVHGFASSIGGLIDIPHGVLCGKLNATVMERIFIEIRSQDTHYTEEMIKLNKLCEFAGIGFVKGDERIDALIERFYRLENNLNLPSLSRYNLTEDLSRKAAGITSCKESPIKFNESQLLEMIIKNI